jgi:SAM-dependent methyltransferase
VTRITGERVSTPAGGFKPTWERHVAAYAAAADLLPPGRTLDLGCGVGHSYRLLAPRETVGVDIAPEVLEGQDRTTIVADMRALPFPDGSFENVVSVQSIEHVPDPERVLAEARRVLVAGGTAMFVTPNRLTFGVPGEVVDPYHWVEYDAAELRAVCGRFFAEVELMGLFGSDRYQAVVAEERGRLDGLLRRDPLRLRRLVPRRVRQRMYDLVLSRERAEATPLEQAIGPEDFSVGREALDDALDLIALCRTA